MIQAGFPPEIFLIILGITVIGGFALGYLAVSLLLLI